MHDRIGQHAGTRALYSRNPLAEVRRCMRYSRSCIAIILLLLLPSVAPALDLFGQSRTYLTTREKVDATRQTQLYEYLDFSLSHNDGANVSFNFGGWYRHDMAGEGADSTDDDDIQYAYLSLKRGTGNGMLNLGRIVVHEGVVSEIVDGIHGRTDLQAGFTVALFGGRPVETQTDGHRGDSLVGARVAQGVPGLYLVGVSSLDEKNGDRKFRREQGLDLWLRPLRRLELQGASTYNAIDRGWMQHRYNVGLGLFDGLRLNGEYTQVDYRQYFASATMSAFQFPNIDQDEKVTTTGGSVEYAVTKSLTAVADYRGFKYDIAGPAGYYGGKLRYAGTAFGAGLGFHRMDGATDRLKYDEYTAYASWKGASADIALQLIHIAYKEEISGIRSGDSASAAAGYAFTPKLRIVADVQYSRNPDFNRDVRAMATLVYRFDTTFAKMSGGRKKL